MYAITQTAVMLHIRQLAATMLRQKRPLGVTRGTLIPMIMRTYRSLSKLVRALQ
jgi:hypothetical protein